MVDFRRPPKLDRRDPIGADWLNDVANKVLASIRMEGGTATRIGTNLVLSVDRQPNTSWTPIAIIGATATGINDVNGNPVQWKYEAFEVYKAVAGYGGWVQFGWTGDAFNMAEDSNSATGRQPSNGVDHGGTDYPAGFAMQPIQIGVIVPAIIIPVGPAGSVVEEAWFWPIPNGEDGTCD